jgi:recombination protein RecT
MSESAVAAAPAAKPGAGTVALALQKMAPQLMAALPAHIKAERMIRVALSAVRRNPKLLQCDIRSLLGAVLQSAQLGLECDGLLGEAYLVPFGKEVTLIPGYRGLLKIARQSALISTVSARVVYANDKFDYEYGLHERLHHVPSRDPDWGGLIYVYAVAHMKDGGWQFEVMSLGEVERIRDNSQGYQASQKFKFPSPWTSHFPEMAKKTVLRRLCKMLPGSIELQRAVMMDEHADAGVGQNLIEALDVDGIVVPGEGEADTEPVEGRRLPLKGRKSQLDIQVVTPPPPPATPDREPGSEG